MNSAFEWVSKLAEWFGQFIPRWDIVDTTHGAVKFVGGKRAVALGPGVHFYWPARTTFFKYPTARQGERLDSQTLVTDDGKTIGIKGMIIYEVKDILPLLANTYEPSHTIKEIAMTCFHDVICQLDWATIREQQKNGKLERVIRAEARKALEPYGVRVLKTMLTDLTDKVRAYKFLNDDTPAQLTG